MYALVRLSAVGFLRSIASRIFLLYIQNVAPRVIRDRQLLEEKWTSIIEDDTGKGQTEVQTDDGR